MAETVKNNGGKYVALVEGSIPTGADGAYCTIGGRSARLLRVVAEHADLWNVPGDDLDDAIARSALLNRYCVEIGRDPGSLTRSVYLSVSYDRPEITRDAIDRAIAGGFAHIVLGLASPYPDGVASWVADELVNTAGA